MYNNHPTIQVRNMHSSSHYYPHLGWNRKSTENYEDFVPFTPCLTPAALSDESSSISSPMLSDRNYTIKSEPLPQLPLKPTDNSHGFGGTDIKGDSRANWSVSPLLQPTMSFSPQGNSPSSYYASSSSRSPSHSDYTYNSFQSSGLQGSPPKKKSKSQSSSYHDQARVFSTPTAPKTVDMPYYSSQSYSRGGDSSGHSTASRSSKGKTTTDHQQSQSQPRKYRFVSVQSADAHQGHGSGSRDDSKVYLEEHLEDDPEDGPFEHGPSEYPPRPYAGGEYASSPLRPKKATGKIPASNLEFLPVLEARFDRLENAIQRYVEYRGQQALENSVLPHESRSRSTSRRRN